MGRNRQAPVQVQGGDEPAGQLDFAAKKRYKKKLYGNPAQLSTAVMCVLSAVEAALPAAAGYLKLRPSDGTSVRPVPLLSLFDGCRLVLH